MKQKIKVEGGGGEGAAIGELLSLEEAKSSLGDISGEIASAKG